MRWSIIAILFLIVGCSTQPDNAVNSAFIHPERPMPVNSPVVSFRVHTVGDGQEVSVSKDDALELGKYLIDIRRYIEQNNTVLCFYRKELVEPQCVESEE